MHGLLAPQDVTADRRLEALRTHYGHLDGEALLAAAVGEAFPGRIAVVSSFGVQSAVLLAMLARIDPAVPVIFLETGKHFAETLAYRDRLVARLGLADVRSVRPEPADLARHDAGGELWLRQPDRCCHVRKVLPLERALTGFEAWVTGRKRYHAGTRAGLPHLEAEAGRIKVNPLAAWTRAEVDEAFRATGLPEHPLAAAGYTSIGCAPCTRRPAPGEDARAGRWAGLEKTECGIHRTRWTAGSGRGDDVRETR